MKEIINIAIIDNDKCFLSMMKGYCFAHNITLTEVSFDTHGIIELKKLNSVLLILPLDLLNKPNKKFEANLIKNMVINDQVQICVLKNSPKDIIPSDLLEWLSVIINNRLDMVEIDQNLKKYLNITNEPTERRFVQDRRSYLDRRHSDNHQINNNPGSKPELRKKEYRDFKIDQRNKCVILKGDKVNLTPKEFELFELLLTDVERVFLTEEIIKHLWRESDRATKSDLYQYMHLLRKKIEKNPNKPQWILTIKGFGYKLNIDNTEEIIRYDNSNLSKVANLFESNIPMHSLAYPTSQ